MSKILCIPEGFASAITDGLLKKDELTISYWMKPIFEKKHNLDFGSKDPERKGPHWKQYKEIHSTHLWSRFQLAWFIRKNAKPENELTVIAKSFGTEETKDYFNTRRGIRHLKKFKSVTIFFIDANSGKVKEEARTLDMTKVKEQVPGVKMYSFYQHNKRPWGSYVTWAVNQQLSDVDHFSIIKDPRVLESVENLC